jgi:uncharacterized protein DUF4389
MSAYTYGSAGPAQAPAVGQPAPVLVSFAGSSPQSRATVLFRIFMAIPQLIVVYLLGVAAYVITFIGWFGALFTGRLPVFAADFLTGYLRWLSRVYAYLYLLTDEYPPFTLADAEYPVRLAVMPGQLNRLAVLFRIFLLIPCQAYGTQPGYGAPQGYIAGPVAGRQWLLSLSAPARRLMVSFIVLGVVILAAVSYLDAAAFGR